MIVHTDLPVYWNNKVMSIAIYILNIIKKNGFLASFFTTFPVFRMKRPDWRRVVADLDWIHISMQMCCRKKKIRIPQDLIKLNPVSRFYYERFRVYIQILDWFMSVSKKASVWPVSQVLPWKPCAHFPACLVQIPPATTVPIKQWPEAEVNQDNKQNKSPGLCESSWRRFPLGHGSVHGCKFCSNCEYFKGDEASSEVVITANDVFLV